MALRTIAGRGRPDGSSDVGAGTSPTRAPGISRPDVLPADFYARPVLEVARDLIGCIVEHRGVSGRIVETEAYHESEPACHAFVGVTPRTRTLFGDPGLAYVYRSYGIHALFNAVCEPAGVGAAVLIRALEPLRGIEQMRARRGRGGVGPRETDLCSGPGKLTQALAIELSENGTSLLDGPVTIHLASESRRNKRESTAAGSTRAATLAVGTRIGITKAVELRWRFCAVGNPHVSRPRPAAWIERAQCPDMSRH